MHPYSTPIPFTNGDVLSSILGGIIFIALISFIKEPYRQKIMVVMLGIAGGVYVNNGLGLGMPIAISLGLFAFKGLNSYRFIALGWLVHTVADIFHHSKGYPMIHNDALSSFGCAIFDVIIAIWFFVNAPSIYKPFQKYFTINN
ncbi:MAG: DUF6010 family protein [Leadbetterella sp.]